MQTAWKLRPGTWTSERDQNEPGRILLHRFDERQTRAITERARSLKLLGGSTALLAGLTAASLVRAADLGPRRILWVPVPASTRSADEPGAWLGNGLCGMNLCLLAGDLGGAVPAMDAATSAWRAAVRRQEHVISGDLLATAQWLPPPLFELLLRGPTLRGPRTLLASYVRLDPGPDGRMFGLPCDEAVLVGTADHKPGLGMLWSRTHDRLQVAVTTCGNRYAEPMLEALIELVEEAANPSS